MQPKHNPLTFYLRTLMYMVMALLVRLVALAPLAFLFAFEEGSWLRYLALLCPVLILLVVLPMRFSFAEALVQKPRQRYFSFDSAFGMGLYGEKLGESLLHFVNVLKWGVPFALMLGGCYYLYRSVDVFTIIPELSRIGEGVTGVWNAVGNFFITLFGGTDTLTYKGGLGEGIAVLAAVLCLGLLIWLYGTVRNSATRYVWVLATRAERSPRTEVRRRLYGRRRKQLLVALANLVLWVPFAVVVYMALSDVLKEMPSKLMMALAQRSLPGFDFSSLVQPLLFAFFCLYLPLLPVRRCTVAAFAAHDARHAIPGKHAERQIPSAEGYQPKPAPELFEDLDYTDEPAQCAVPTQEIPKPSVFAEASDSQPELTPMAADSRADGAVWEYKPYDPAENDAFAADNSAAEQAREAQPETDKTDSAEFSARSMDAPPANDPTTFTIGQ